MKGLNIWGICTFVMPLVIAIISTLLLVTRMILDGVSKFIKRIRM